MPPIQSSTATQTTDHTVVSRRDLAPITRRPSRGGDDGDVVTLSDMEETPAITLRTEKVGPFVSREPLGRGGMAEVSLAIDPRRHGVHRLVALKRLRPGLVQATSADEMFGDEARIASLVHHPNVRGVTAFGHDDAGRPYMAMEYLCGEPLTSPRAAVGSRRARTIDQPAPGAGWSSSSRSWPRSPTRCTRCTRFATRTAPRSTPFTETSRRRTSW